MAVLEVLRFPDEQLRTVAQPVTEFDDSLKAFVDDMFETMRAENGIGLAATQVNHHRRIIVMDVSAEQNEPHVFINPEIIASKGTMINEEGCLSVPDSFAKVERAEQITVRAMDVTGNLFELEADGLLAVCIQHEMDHLIGKLFIDYLSPLKRKRIKQKLEKEQKRLARAE